MTNRSIFIWSAALAVTLLLPGSLGAVQQRMESDVDAQADRILREMGEYLSSAEEYTFEADIAYDEIEGEQKILFGGVAHISIRRPNRLNVEFNGDERQSRVVFDGKTVTLHNVAKNVYAVAEAPPEIDAALDRLFEVYGASVPIADLVYADPYRTLIENVEDGFVVGQHPVNGIRCHHLAFWQEGDRLADLDRGRAAPGAAEAGHHVQGRTGLATIHRRAVGMELPSAAIGSLLHVSSTRGIGRDRIPAISRTHSAK